MNLFNKDNSRNLVIVGLVFLAMVEVLSIAFTVPNTSDVSGITTQNQQQENIARTPILKLSEIRGSRIDDEAAMIVVEESLQAAETEASCFALPKGIWIFLLVAYVALLIFNFSYTFKQVVRPQWVWETILTVLALVSWYIWDGCQNSLWFPFAVVKLGLIVFVSYVYLLEKSLREEKEKAARLF